MNRQITREPSFCGNTGNKGNTQQSCGLQPLPIGKRGGNKGNTYLYLGIEIHIVCSHFKKVATGCQKKYQLNQCYCLCCHVAAVFENSQGNIRGVALLVMRIICKRLSASTLPPSWQAIFLLFTFSRRWGNGSTSSPCTPNAQWRAS